MRHMGANRNAWQNCAGQRVPADDWHNPAPDPTTTTGATSRLHSRRMVESAGVVTRLVCCYLSPPEVACRDNNGCESPDL